MLLLCRAWLLQWIILKQISCYDWAKKRMLEGGGLLRTKDLSENRNIMVGWCQEKSFSFLSLVVKFSACWRVQITKMLVPESKKIRREIAKVRTDVQKGRRRKPRNRSEMGFKSRNNREYNLMIYSINLYLGFWKWNLKIRDRSSKSSASNLSPR